MQGFVDDLDRSDRPSSHEALKDFRTLLGRSEQHPKQRYFVLKSIVINNLYGVDIMDEAVEVCKLRLFLKLVAQVERFEEIEPLPDIDFNILAGNSIVGFANAESLRKSMHRAPNGQIRLISSEAEEAYQRIEDEASQTSREFEAFQKLQTRRDYEIDVYRTAKTSLKIRMGKLRKELDRYLATEYGIYSADSEEFDKCKTTHSPFHWYSEFFGVIQKGGFSVIIGNPPYVEYSKVKKDYQIVDLRTENCGNLYAFVWERSFDLIKDAGRVGVIVPLSSLSTARMESFQELTLDSSRKLWASYYSGDANPSRLFEGVKLRLAILLSEQGKGKTEYFSTTYLKWYAAERHVLFSTLKYTESTDLIKHSTFPKIGDELGKRILSKMSSAGKELRVIGSSGGHECHFHNCPVNWIRCTTFIPSFESERDGPKVSTQLKNLNFRDENTRNIVCSILNSTLFFINWITYSDCYHLIDRELGGFVCPIETLSTDRSLDINALVTKLMKDYLAKSKKRVYVYKTSGRVEYDEFYPKLSKDIIDEIDNFLATHYGLTEQELDYTLNFGIKYRMGITG